MDEIYRRLPPEQIPWNLEGPPKILVELVETKRVLPCRTAELGCGLGHAAVYLAGRGLDVNGVDISPTALRLAEERARENAVLCRFVVADVLGDLTNLGEDYRFAYDWELLHHIFPEHRQAYAGNVARLLSPGGLYLSVCFAEEDRHFGGVGKLRETPLGTVLYFSSETEIRELFQPLFHMDELKTVEIEGRHAPHRAVYALMRKE